MADLTIKRQIDVGYRSYALYVIESRGIPNWYDSLTNGQRILIDNCPSSFTKTLTVVGNAIASGYHSGDASLVSTINKLARPFNCAEPVMVGDGFFGCPVSHNAASARYTSVKINPKMREITNRYYHLNKKNEDGVFDNLIVDTPFGLCSGAMGIAVGYKTTILPRKLEDITDFMHGKRKSVPPSFNGFNGKVKKHGDDRTWIIEGVVDVDDKKRKIHVTSIPPMMRFDAFLKKLNSVLTETSFDFQNNSASDVDVTISISKSETNDSWNRVCDAVVKSTKMIVHESIIFVKDRGIVEYERVEDYLLDFSEYNQKVMLDNLTWNLQEESEELKFLCAKLEYMKFLMFKKRTQSEIEEHLKVHEKRTHDRLDSLKMRVLSTDEIKKTEDAIKSQRILLDEIRRDLKAQQKTVNSMTFELRGKKIKPAEQLFEVSEENGIEIFANDDEQEEESYV
jgi:DNA gyrase/topoisomerase IV subunit A